MDLERTTFLYLTNKQCLREKGKSYLQRDALRESNPFTAFKSTAFLRSIAKENIRGTSGDPNPHQVEQWHMSLRIFRRCLPPEHASFRSPGAFLGGKKYTRRDFTADQSRLILWRPGTHPCCSRR